MNSTTNNTPTPAQALGEVLKLSELATPGEWVINHCSRCDVSGICCAGHGEILFTHAMGEDDYGAASVDDAAFIVALVNWARQHGQHFAGLEQQVAMAEEDAEWLRQQIKERIARYEAAEARVREAEGLLLYIADTVSHESLGDAANMLAAFRGVNQ